MFTRTFKYSGPGYTGIEFDPETFMLSKDGERCLIEFLEYCKSQNLENIVFVNFPWDVEVKDNYVAKIVERYGYPFLDMQKEMDRIGLDVKCDFYDVQHVNAYGQAKLMEYLGTVLVNEYGVVPREQSPENQMLWEICATHMREYYLLADQFIMEDLDTYITELSGRWAERNNWLYRER